MDIRDIISRSALIPALEEDQRAQWEHPRARSYPVPSRRPSSSHSFSVAPRPDGQTARRPAGQPQTRAVLCRRRNGRRSIVSSPLPPSSTKPILFSTTAPFSIIHHISIYVSRYPITHVQNGRSTHPISEISNFGGARQADTTPFIVDSFPIILLSRSHHNSKSQQQHQTVSCPPKVHNQRSAPHNK